MKKRQGKVVIIGGGIIGTSIAYFLAKKGMGKDLIVCERGDLAAGTTGATDGYLFLQTKKPGLHLEMAIESVLLYDQLSQELDSHLGYKRQGGWMVIETEAEWQVMEKIASEHGEGGIQIEMMKIDDVRRVEPELAHDLKGASYCSFDGSINSLNVTFALARKAREMGVLFLNGAEVKGLNPTQSRRWNVETTQGDIEADVIVNAAGCWAPSVGRMVGLDIPIRPRRGQIMVTEPIGTFIQKPMLCGRYCTIKHQPEMLQQLHPHIQALGLGFGVEQTENGNLFINNTREWSDFAQNTTIDGIKAILAGAIRMLPRLQDVHIIRTFAGLRPYTPDGLPILGPIEGHQGFLMAAGHEGDGITLAPITGKLMAEYIVDGKTSFPLDNFLFNRFVS